MFYSYVYFYILIFSYVNYISCSHIVIYCSCLYISFLLVIQHPYSTFAIHIFFLCSYLNFVIVILSFYFSFSFLFLSFYFYILGFTFILLSIYHFQHHFYFFFSFSFSFLCFIYFIPFLSLYSYSICTFYPTEYQFNVLIYSSVSISITFILFSCSHLYIFILFWSCFIVIFIFIIYISIISILFICSHFIHFILLSCPEFSVHFTEEMRPNGEELPKLSLCDVCRHKMMQCDVVTPVKGGLSRGNRLVKLLRK